MSYADDPKMQEFLRRPFPPKLIGRLPKTPKRPALDYVGHAAVTDRLNAAAPDWSYVVEKEWMVDATFWIRIAITVGGVTRPEYGDGDDPKEAIGNAIRRGAMRFGVALDLWSKEELTSATSSPAARSQEVPSGRDGDAGSGAVPAGGDREGSPGAAPSAGPYDPHPNKPHVLKDSQTLEGARYCIVKGCDYVLAPTDAKPIRQEVP